MTHPRKGTELGLFRASGRVRHRKVAGAAFVSAGAVLDRAAEDAIITAPERKPESGGPFGPSTKQFEVRARRARRARTAVLMHGEQARPSSNDTLARNAPVIGARSSVG